MESHGKLYMSIYICKITLISEEISFSEEISSSNGSVNILYLPTVLVQHLPRAISMDSRIISKQEEVLLSSCPWFFFSPSLPFLWPHKPPKQVSLLLTYVLGFNRSDQIGLGKRCCPLLLLRPMLKSSHFCREALITVRP